MIKIGKNNHFRIINEKNEDITIEKFSPNNEIKLQIDYSGDGLFNTNTDITIDDKKTLSLFFDNKRYSNNKLKNIIFSKEIRFHIINNKIILDKLEKALLIGKEVSKTSNLNIIRKVKLGKEALFKLFSAYYKDKSHPFARACLCNVLLTLYKHPFSKLIQKKLDIDFLDNIEEIKNILFEDIYEPLGQFTLNEINSKIDKDLENFNLIGFNLNRIRNIQPEYYDNSLKIFNSINNNLSRIS